MTDFPAPAHQVTNGLGAFSWVGTFSDYHLTACPHPRQGEDRLPINGLS